MRRFLVGLAVTVLMFVAMPATAQEPTILEGQVQDYDDSCPPAGTDCTFNLIREDGDKFTVRINDDEVYGSCSIAQSLSGGETEVYVAVSSHSVEWTPGVYLASYVLEGEITLNYSCQPPSWCP